MWLACIAGSISGRRAPLGTTELTIGRDPGNTLVINEPQVSRRHARLFMRNNEVLIVDLDSTTGTYVDNQRIASPTPLTSSSLIQIGSTLLKLDGVSDRTQQQVSGSNHSPPVLSPPVTPLPFQLPDGCLFRATGKRCALEVFPEKIRITRESGISNFIIHGLRGDKEIFIRSISGLQFKPVDSFTVGYLQFTFSGGLETKKALIDAVQDENTVIFEARDQAGFEYAKVLIEQRMAAIHSPQLSVLSPADELLKLHQLLQAGAISQAEFDTHKRRLGF